MKTWMWFIEISFLVLSAQSFVWGSAPEDVESEEVPYEQLVRELNSRVSKQQRQALQSTSVDPFEQLKIHVSLGFVQTVNSFVIEDRTLSRLEDGIQLGVGIDLFTPEWVAEGLLKNFGQSRQNDSTVALREFDLRLSYLQSAPQSKMKLRMSNGLGARYLRYRSDWSQLNTYQTTPVYLLGLGFLVPIGNHFDLDFEFQGHMSLVSDTMDRHGLALVLRLDNVF
jgi:hypothetical protein